MNKVDTLARLLGTRVAADAAHAGQTVGVRPLAAAKVVDISRIVPDPDQPRKVFDADDLALLAGSLKDIGQQVPVQVRWDAGQDRWVLIDGERRWRAAQQAGLPTLMVVVDDRGMPPGRVLELQLVENALRSDLTPLESGAAYQQLMAVWHCNQQQLAARLHISPSKVSRAIAALTLPTEVQQAVETGKVGAVAAVMKARRKPAASGRRADRPAPVRIPTPAGVVVVTPKPGRSVVDALAAALDAERQRGAA
jgi:ParB family chromosome partitioning protein